jgi:hypothetical protein
MAWLGYVKAKGVPQNHELPKQTNQIEISDDIEGVTSFS